MANILDGIEVETVAVKHENNDVVKGYVATVSVDGASFSGEGPSERAALVQLVKLLAHIMMK